MHYNLWFISHKLLFNAEIYHFVKKTIHIFHGAFTEKYPSPHKKSVALNPLPWKISSAEPRFGHIIQLFKGRLHPGNVRMKQTSWVHIQSNDGVKIKFHSCDLIFWVVLVKIPPVLWDIIPCELVIGNYVLKELAAFHFTNAVHPNMFWRNHLQWMCNKVIGESCSYWS